MIKEHELYPVYLTYLQSKKLSTGHFNMSKISESKFNEFVDRYIKDEEFMKNQYHIYKVSLRQSTIVDILSEDILEEEDFQIFLDDLDNNDISHIKDDDIFDF